MIQYPRDPATVSVPGRPLEGLAKSHCPMNAIAFLRPTERRSTGMTAASDRDALLTIRAHDTNDIHRATATWSSGTMPCSDVASGGNFHGRGVPSSTWAGVGCDAQTGRVLSIYLAVEVNG